MTTDKTPSQIEVPQIGNDRAEASGSIRASAERAAIEQARPQPPTCRFCDKPQSDELHQADENLLKHSTFAKDDYHDFADAPDWEKKIAAAAEPAPERTLDWKMEVDLDGTLKVWPPIGWSAGDFAEYINRSLARAVAVPEPAAQQELTCHECRGRSAECVRCKGTGKIRLPEYARKSAAEIIFRIRRGYMGVFNDGVENRTFIEECHEQAAGRMATIIETEVARARQAEPAPTPSRTELDFSAGRKLAEEILLEPDVTYTERVLAETVIGLAENKR